MANINRLFDVDESVTTSALCKRYGFDFNILDVSDDYVEWEDEQAHDSAQFDPNWFIDEFDGSEHLPSKEWLNGGCYWCVNGDLWLLMLRPHDKVAKHLFEIGKAATKALGIPVQEAV